MKQTPDFSVICSKPPFFVLWLLLLSAPAFGQKSDKAAERDKALQAADGKAFKQNMQDFETHVQPFLKEHCIGCHGPARLEGDLALDLLDPDMKASASAARWAMVREKLATAEMPPEGSKRPAAAETAPVLDWIRAEMKRARRNFARRAQQIHGNRTPHDLLFDPAHTAPLNVPARVRRLSPEIYDSIRRRQAKGFENLVGNPFTPDPRFLFRDMDTPEFDVPTTSQLLRNALTIIERQTGYRIQDGRLQPLPGAKREFLTFMDPQQPLEAEHMAKMVTMQFQRTLGRSPYPDELQRFVALMSKNVAEAGRVAGIRYSLAAVFLLPSAVFRYEVGSAADADRIRRLTPEEIAFALAYSLTDERPPPWLLESAVSGNLDDQSGVAAAVRSLLYDARIRRPRILRFFHEYFEYPKAVEVFKNPEDFRYHKARVLVSDTDNLVRWILERDRDVLKELLTTNRTFVNTRYDSNKQTLERYEAKGAIHESYSLPPDWKYTDEQPIEMPSEVRCGILTQPSWLVAWSVNQDNHAILRGKWVRERLLGNVVPDIPITVDAQLPDAPEKTLRERMAVTQQEYCWQCHKLMNDVGLPFENYDHFGRWRATELGKPVNAAGAVDLSGDSALDGTTTSTAAEFLRRLAESERVERVFIRHVFRYFTGRNENAGDGPALRDAQQAYRANNGSFNALIVSILSSDSFLYRTSHQTASSGSLP